MERANKWAHELSLDDQVHYVFTNVSISLAELLQSYPGPIAALSAQFPDPHFKKRHKKRRMVQQSVVQAARELLMPGGECKCGIYMPPDSAMRVKTFSIGDGTTGSVSVHHRESTTM